ncbi:hypothetical protein REG_0204 [Candidatus Regiella insecticola LSR1]|uniref:Ubiquinone biosynthesis accessory factor UbiK n=2 Tax=Candidatus Regiella insecticola TaxID=138073 RepID=E0WQN1_9ENTR|nr:hypothetical protein REG_0204 [Candidatus Regiella insecticola LSR1]
MARILYYARSLLYSHYRVVSLREAYMFGLKIVEMITKKVQGSLPETANRFKDNIEKKVGNALQAQLPRLNLINREEFDVQSKILSDTSEKLALLERKLEALEAKLGSDTPEAQSSSDIEKTIP